MGNYIKSQDGSVAPAHMIQLGAGLKMTAQADSTLLELSADGGADWAQNDPNGEGYIKNRPFYTTDPFETVLYENNSLELADASGSAGASLGTARFAASLNGDTFTCVINGVSYEAERKNYNGYDYLGNISLLLQGEDTGEPYFILDGHGACELYTNIAVSGTISLAIKAYVTEDIKVPDKYMPDRVMILPPPDELTEESALKYMDEFEKGTTLYFIPGTDEIEQVICYRYTELLGFSFVSMGLRKIRRYEGGIGENYDSSMLKIYKYDDITKYLSFSETQYFSAEERKLIQSNIGITYGGDVAPNKNYFDFWVDKRFGRPILRVYDTSTGYNTVCGVFRHTGNPLWIASESGKVFEIQVDDSGNITAIERTGV